MPRPQSIWQIDINSWKLFLLFMMPYTAFYGVPALPTWRIVNLLFVVISVLFFRYHNQRDSSPKGLLVWHIAFFAWCCLQCGFLANEGRFGNYEAIFLIGLVVLFAFCHFFYQLLTAALPRVLTTLYFSLLLLLGYQVFQEAVFLLGKREWATLLNERGIEHVALFYRVIGPLLGSPGFMAEAGHVALFVGPLLMSFILLGHYQIAKVPRWALVVCTASLLICLSGGAVVDGLFLGLMLLIINFERFNAKQFGLLVAIALGFAGLVLLVPAYQEVIVFRVSSLFTGDSERLRGAETFLAVWEENWLMGLAPKASRFLSADPNVFIPVMLADHGIVGLFLLLGIWFVPLYYAWQGSRHPLFVLPYLALTTHLFLAYGTYTWPIVWINLMLALWGLHHGKSKMSASSSLQSDSEV